MTASKIKHFSSSLFSAVVVYPSVSQPNHWDIHWTGEEARQSAHRLCPVHNHGHLLDTVVGMNIFQHTLYQYTIYIKRRE